MVGDAVFIAGVGSYGRGWYEALCERFGPGRVVVVDPDEAARRSVHPDSRAFSAIEPAFSAVARPWFLLNAAPPDAHTALNRAAFQRGVPVLCEKPIAPTFAECRAVVDAARAAGVPFMVAENHRRSAAMRRARRLIEEGNIGRPVSLHGFLYEPYRTDKKYWSELRHPFLEDVVLHVFDLARYLMDDEAASVAALSFSPPQSWHPGPAAATVTMKMRGGAVVTFAGSLATRGAPTGWLGRWRMEGETGVLEIENGRLRWEGDGGRGDEDPSSFPAPGPLDDFLELLAGKPMAESSGEDYLWTQSLLDAAVQSAESGGVPVVPEPLCRRPR